MKKLCLRLTRWAALAVCVSVPHFLPPGLHWPAALALVALAAASDFLSTSGGA